MARQQQIVSLADSTGMDPLVHSYSFKVYLCGCVCDGVLGCLIMEYYVHRLPAHVKALGEKCASLLQCYQKMHIVQYLS